MITVHSWQQIKFVWLQNLPNKQPRFEMLLRCVLRLRRDTLVWINILGTQWAGLSMVC